MADDDSKILLPGLVALRRVCDCTGAVLLAVGLCVLLMLNGRALASSPPVKATVVGHFAVPGHGYEILAADGKLWLGGQKLAAFNPSRRSFQTADVPYPPGAPYLLASTGAKIWAASFGNHYLNAYDPTTMAAAGSATPGGDISGLEYASGALWVTVDEPYVVGNSGAVLKLNPVTGAVITENRYSYELGGMALADGQLWSVEVTRGMGLVRVIKPASGLVVGNPIKVGKYPIGVLYAAGRLWVSNSDSNTVSVISVTRHRVLATIPVGQGPQGMAAADGRVWVANTGNGNTGGHTISEIDEATLKVAATVTVSDGACFDTVAYGSLWVTSCYKGVLTQIRLSIG